MQWRKMPSGSGREPKSVFLEAILKRHCRIMNSFFYPTEESEEFE